jgi:hypothetical protein
MNWIDLGNPSPLRTPKRYSPIVWPDGAVVPLPTWTVAANVVRPFCELLSDRRTCREFSILKQEGLGALLDLACRVQQTGDRALGFPLSRRPTPAAGAIHAIHLLVICPNQNVWYRYDAFTHSLRQFHSASDPQLVRHAMNDVLPAPRATMILFAAEPGMMAAKYAAPMSLVWRDAGVLLGFLAMVAQALDLSFCPLGVTGEPWVSQLLDQPGLFGVGAALVGSRP